MFFYPPLKIKLFCNAQSLDGAQNVPICIIILGGVFVLLLIFTQIFIIITP